MVGQFDVDWSGDVRPGSRLHTATARLRTVIRRGASELPGDDAALLRGIVVGDDADQPPAMVERFRASGLAHLTAVSGQNVAFVLAAAGPVLRRRGAGARWALTIVLIAWFVLLTRLEPSVMRAGAMAALAATAYATGAERTPWRTLLIAVIGLLLIDPLLVTSVGFWLSTGATAGVVVAGPPLTRRLHRLGVFAGPLGITLGAQIGVALPSLLVFGRLPLVGIAANVVAVPVAGAVMLYGLPAVIVAGVCPPLGMVLLAPAWAGVWWVDSVATVGARLEPHGAAATVAWCLTALALVGIVVRGAHRGDILDGDERPPPAR